MRLKITTLRTRTATGYHATFGSVYNNQRNIIAHSIHLRQWTDTLATHVHRAMRTTRTQTKWYALDTKAAKPTKPTPSRVSDPADMRLAPHLNEACERDAPPSPLAHPEGSGA